MNLDAKTAGGGTLALAVIAALGVLAGKLVFETPEGRQSAIDLAACQVRVEEATARIDRLTIARDRCEDILRPEATP